MVLEKVFLESIDASIPTVLVYFEGIGPFALFGSGNVMIMSTNIDVVVVFEPI